MISACYRQTGLKTLLLGLVLAIAVGVSATQAGAAEKTRAIGGAQPSRPIITCPPDVTVDCSESLDPSNTGWPTISGGYPPYDTTYIDEITEQGRCPFIYVIARTWTVTDDIGDSRDCIQMISVEDNEAPVFVCCPPDAVVSCDSDIPSLPHAVAIDNCNPEPDVRYEETRMPGRCPNEYLILRHWEATDGCCNMSACQQTVRVRDMLAPVLTAAPDEVLPCNEQAAFTEPSVSDNCDEAPIVRIVAEFTEPGPGKCQETHRKCWVAQDGCGNISETRCQALVTTADTEPPEIAPCPTSRIEWGETVEFSLPSITDNCDDNPIVGVTSDARFAGPELGESTFTRCWQAQDACGNVSGEGCESIIMGGCPLWFCAFGCWDWASACLDGENHDVSTRPACIRDEYFDEIFPNGVRIGAAGGPGRYEAVWTTPEAIEEFMCGYGFPAPLDADYVNPRRNQTGVLEGEILALRLNREFSCYGAFSEYGYDPLRSCYGAFMVPGNVPRFAGLSVDEFLAVSDDAISGNVDALRPYGATYTHLYGAAAYLNWLFGDCRGCGPRDGNGPLLNRVDGDDRGDEGKDQLVPDGQPRKVRVTSHPNPLQDGTTISLALPAECRVALMIYDVEGRNVATVFSGHKAAGYHDFLWEARDSSGNPVVSGVYFCRLEIEGQPARLSKLIKM